MKIGKDKDSDELLTLKEDAIKFTYPCGDLRIAVLNSKILKGADTDKVFLGKFVEGDDYNEIKELTDEEYMKAEKRLKSILFAFSEEEE